MESRNNQQKILIKHANLDKEAILRKYAGIFKDNIREFANVVIPKLKQQKNYSR